MNMLQWKMHRIEAILPPPLVMICQSRSPDDWLGWKPGKMIVVGDRDALTPMPVVMDENPSALGCIAGFISDDDC